MRWGLGAGGGGGLVRGWMGEFVRMWTGVVRGWMGGVVRRWSGRGAVSCETERVDGEGGGVCERANGGGCGCGRADGRGVCDSMRGWVGDIL